MGLGVLRLGMVRYGPLWLGQARWAQVGCGMAKQTAAQRRYVRLASSINTKASKLGRNGRVTANDLGAIFLASGGACVYCSTEIDPLMCSFDHVQPFDSGGENEPSNIAATCMSCQRSKARRSVEVYQEARKLRVQCEVCGIEFQPRWADWIRGYGRTCSAKCAGLKGRHTRDGLYA